MISPELLRRYSLFGCLSEAEQRAISLVAEQVICEQGPILFEEGQLIEALHFLVEGSVDLYYKVQGDGRDPLLVCEVSVGEAFGISAMIEPHNLTATARVSRPSRILKIPAAVLRALCEADSRLGVCLDAPGGARRDGAAALCPRAVGGRTRLNNGIVRTLQGSAPAAQALAPNPA